MLHTIERFFTCLFYWRRPVPDRTLNDAQVIIVLACSDLANGETSLTNRQLADYAIVYHRLLSLPIIAQGEVARAIKDKGVPVFSQTRLQTTARPLDPRYLDTQAVAEHDRTLCREQGWTRILLFAYVPYVWRARWVYERLGLQIIIPRNLPHIIFEDFAQKRLSRRQTLYPFELIARLVYLWRGNI